MTSLIDMNDVRNIRSTIQLHQENLTQHLTNYYQKQVLRTGCTLYWIALAVLNCPVLLALQLFSIFIQTLHLFNCYNETGVPDESLRFLVETVSVEEPNTHHGDKRKVHYPLYHQNSHLSSIRVHYS